MRGLSAAEHQQLVELAEPSPDVYFETGDICEVWLVALVVAKRASLTFEDNVRRYSITQLGRLALRLWPLNRSE